MPNKTVNHLGLVVDVNLHKSGRDLLELIEKGFIQKSGTTGKGTIYIFRQRKA